MNKDKKYKESRLIFISNYTYIVSNYIFLTIRFRIIIVI